MRITTRSGREFNQVSSKAKKAADRGPVFITDTGWSTHVLLSIEDYRRLTGRRTSLLDAIVDVPDFDFDPSRLGARFLEPAELE